MGGQKLTIIRRNFGQLQTSIANISGTHQAENDVINYDPVYARRKKVNFSPLNFRAYAGNVYAPKFNLFDISPPGGGAPLKFLHMLQNVKGLLTHTSQRTGVPATISNHKNSENGLKISLLPVITLGPRGITLRNLSA